MQSSDSRFRQTFIKQGVVPLAAVLIALLQILLATTTELTPWKGGGFGMFSVTDNSKMRFFSARGRTPDGRDIRIDMEYALKKKDPVLQKKMAIVPGAKQLEKLGHLFVDGTYVEADPSYQRTMLGRLGLENSGSLRREVDVFANTDFYYWIPEKERGALPYPEVALDEIRVRALKLRFDPGTGRVLTEPLLDEVAVRPS